MICGYAICGYIRTRPIYFTFYPDQVQELEKECRGATIPITPIRVFSPFPSVPCPSLPFLHGPFLPLPFPPWSGPLNAALGPWECCTFFRQGPGRRTRAAKAILAYVPPSKASVGEDLVSSGASNSVQNYTTVYRSWFWKRWEGASPGAPRLNLPVFARGHEACYMVDEQ